MDQFATTPPEERRDIFNEVAVRLGGVDFTIAEKDFWVCWTLSILFGLGADHPNLVFKGGTSLSKAYGIINRFSEDIDIVTAVDYFIERGADDPEDDVSGSERHRRLSRLDEACTKYVSDVLRAELHAQFAERLGTTGWELHIDAEERHGHTLLFKYPWRIRAASTSMFAAASRSSWAGARQQCRRKNVSWFRTRQRSSRNCSSIRLSAALS